MIYRLTYCNKSGDTARVDIQKGASTPVEIIEGTADPFLLSYKMDKGDSSGFIMSSNADISVFESGTFKIDNLKTSSETELRVNYYVNDALTWAGFIVPDFFSRIVGSPAIVEMVATDRIGALKSATIAPSAQHVKIRELLTLCLAKTGLTLPLRTLIDFEVFAITWVGNNIFLKMEVPAQRLVTPRGQSINCYNILKAILVAANAKIVQKGGQWHIYNKMQHAQGAGRLYSTESSYANYAEEVIDFDEVEVGARRTLQPVAASVATFHEFAGGRTYPENFDFRNGLSGWNGSNITLENREITGVEYLPISGLVAQGAHRFVFGAATSESKPLLTASDGTIINPNARIDSALIQVAVSAKASAKISAAITVVAANTAAIQIRI